MCQRTLFSLDALSCASDSGEGSWDLFQEEEDWALQHANCLGLEPSWRRGKDDSNLEKNNSYEITICTIEKFRWWKKSLVAMQYEEKTFCDVELFLYDYTSFFWSRFTIHKVARAQFISSYHTSKKSAKSGKTKNANSDPGWWCKRQAKIWYGVFDGVLTQIRAFVTSSLSIEIFFPPLTL